MKIVSMESKRFGGFFEPKFEGPIDEKLMISDIRKLFATGKISDFIGNVCEYLNRNVSENVAYVIGCYNKAGDAMSILETAALSPFLVEQSDTYVVAFYADDVPDHVAEAALKIIYETEEEAIAAFEN